MYIKLHLFKFCAEMWLLAWHGVGLENGQPFNSKLILGLDLLCIYSLGKKSRPNVFALLRGGLPVVAYVIISSWTASVITAQARAFQSHTLDFQYIHWMCPPL